MKELITGASSHMAARRQKILIVGQTPPPYGGQAMMIHSLVQLQSERIEIHHVRLSFSASMESVGRFQLWKLFHLGGVLARALYVRLRHGVRVLYFSPAGPNLVPVLRDVVLLRALRLLFRKSIFHFHAAGLSQLVESGPKWLRPLAFGAYGSPDGAIQNSERNPPDAAYFGARRVTIIPNGIPDAALPYLPLERRPGEPVRLLYVGTIQEGKGIMILLQAVKELAARRSDFTLWIMGEFFSREFETRVREFYEQHALHEIVTFVGQHVDSAKWDYFRRADLLCFPSYYEAESFGNVVLEAMMFELPVVATRWRGIPDLVDDATGLLVPIKDPAALAEALEQLIADEPRRRKMGGNARRKFLERFTLQAHLREVETFLYDVATD